ncbi:MAG: efflux RND transporter permease subunit [Bacteroidota bacterium]
MSLQFLITRPIAVLSSVFALLLLGGVVMQSLPISLLPETSIPRISVQVSAPNTDAQSLEKTIIQPLRNQLLQVNHLCDIQSRTQDGSANIQLDFEYDTNVDLTYIEVNEKIDQISSLLPRDLERPRVLKASVTDIPVFYLSVLSQQGNSLELADFVKTVLKRRIEQLPQVAFVDVSGYQQAEVGIYPNWAKLQSLGMNEKDLSRILAQNNIDFGSTLIQDGQYQYNVRFLSEIRRPEDIEALYFRHEGQVLQLKDIAEIRLQGRDRSGAYLWNGEAAIVLAVRKQADAQLFALKASFQDLLTAFRQDYPTLEFQLSNDQSTLLKISIDNLRSSLLYGACFAIVVMLLFFRSWKAPLLIAIAIPSSLVITLLFFYLLNISINIISLSGLILGVGLMIDNAIIVIENIQQYRRMGYERTAACVQAVQEVIRPLLSSALTTCSVFLPLVFLSGLAGALFYDQAVSITLALFSSLLVAYILLPTLFRLFLPRQKNRPVQQADFVDANNTYTRSVDVVLRHSWLFLLLFMGLIAVVILPFRQLKQESFPPLSRKAIAINIDWNEALTLAENETRCKSLLEFVDHNSSSIFLGQQQFLLEQSGQNSNEASILLFSEAIPASNSTVRAHLQSHYPNAKVAIAPLKNVFDQVFATEDAPLRLHLQQVSSNTTPSLYQIAPLLNFLRQRDIYPPPPTQIEQYEIRILKAKALLYEVDYETIYQKLQSLFNDYSLGTLKTSSDYIPITIDGDQGALYERIATATVRNQQQQTITLATFLEVQKTQAYKQIEAGKSGVCLMLDLPFFDEELIAALKAFIAEETQLSVYFSGQAFEDQNNLQELSIILGISLLLLYLILAAQFESLLQPFIVILTVPISITGAVCTLYLFQQSLNLVSIIGMIVMSGIVVNDAILKVDMMNRLRKKYDLTTAIHGAGLRRLKPILMTSITTILALLPILFASGLGAELQRPLAYGVIGGLIFGTFSSLYFIPLVYRLVLGRVKEQAKT